MAAAAALLWLFGAAGIALTYALSFAFTVTPLPAAFCLQTACAGKATEHSLNDQCCLVAASKQMLAVSTEFTASC
jgi:hypothetical protein